MDDDRARRAMVALRGLAVGDGFGQRCLESGVGPDGQGRLPPGHWAWTDDTEMACSVCAVLRSHGHVDQEALAASFAARFDPHRGYGAATAQLLETVRAGGHWQVVAAGQFGGAGSFGNGAAMRVAPLGAWFGDGVSRAAQQAGMSARVTHTHPEGVAGAVAVAVAAAIAARREAMGAAAFVEEVLAHVPSGEVSEGIRAARGLLAVSDPVAVGRELGCGHRVSAQDTVPFTMWAAAKHLDDYPMGVWETARAGGDADTTCAIVGGIVATRLPGERMPPEWEHHGEPLPQWVPRS